MSNKQSCLIMMATYNGEKYLSQQIDSIIRQSFDNWNLLIRDDGSSDGTLKILREYEQKDSRIEVLINNGQLHGPYHNFHELICEAKKRQSFDYYAFSDQDDIWKEDKLEKLITYCKDIDDDKIPVFVYSDLTVINSDNQIIDKSVNDILGIDITDIPENLFFAHAYIWGCTALFNYALFSIVQVLNADFPHRDIMSHDNYIAKYAVMYGKLLYYPIPMIFYRKHGENVTDNHKFQLSLLTVLKKAIIGYSDLCKTHARVYNQTLLAIAVMNNNQNNEILSKKFNLIKGLIWSGGIRGVIKLKKLGIRRRQFVRTIALYWVMLIKGYKKYLFNK